MKGQILHRAPHMVAIEEFLNSRCRIRWFAFSDVTIYMRKSTRFTPGARKARHMIDIANVGATRPGKGTFQALLDTVAWLAARHEFQCIYVESVQERRFANFFRRNGWEEVGHPLSPSFVLDLTGSGRSGDDVRGVTGKRGDMVIVDDIDEFQIEHGAKQK